MNISRRQALALSVGAAAFAVAGLRTDAAFAAQEDVDKLIAEFSGGKAPEAGKIALNAPEIAENGNTVPVTVTVESAMSGDDIAEAVMIIASGNPTPAVATFHFTEMSGEATATSRIRLAKTQDVIALAKMKSGAVHMEKKQVKVTIGGCGG